LASSQKPRLDKEDRSGSLPAEQRHSYHVRHDRDRQRQTPPAPFPRTNRRPRRHVGLGFDKNPHRVTPHC
jgi:hypothetical protein